MLEAALRNGVPRVVNTSTGGAIYGETDMLPTPEDARPAPKAPYGNSKLCAETYNELYARLHGLSTLSLRYGNVYGPRQDPLGEAGVIAIFCGRLRRRQADRVRRRPADARLRLRRRHRLGERRRDGSDVTGAVNIGTGVEATVLDLIEALRDIGGADGFEPDFQPARKGEIQRSQIDVTRAREGWAGPRRPACATAWRARSSAPRPEPWHTFVPGGQGGSEPYARDARPRAGARSDRTCG